MKYLFLIIFAPTLTFAKVIDDCGEYALRGVVRSGFSNFTIVVNEKTQSEFVINFPMVESQKLGAYVGRPVSAAVLIYKNNNKTLAYSEKIISVNPRIPDPLNPKDTGLNLTKRIDCK